jgi:hypothetical protein
VGDVRRHGSRHRPVDLDELARQLPEHLWSFPDWTDPRPHWAEVGKWLTNAAPGISGDIMPFLVLVGLDPATFFEAAMRHP